MGAERRSDPRFPAELRVRLGYGSVEEFVEHFAVNVSRGGFFVRTPETSEAGTELAFQILLASGQPVLSGRGVVRFTTTPDSSDERPLGPGMGIRYLSLQPTSKNLVDRMVARRGHLAQSDEPPWPADESSARGLPAGPERTPVRPAGAPATEERQGGGAPTGPMARAPRPGQCSEAIGVIRPTKATVPNPGARKGGTEATPSATADDGASSSAHPGGRSVASASDEGTAVRGGKTTGEAVGSDPGGAPKAPPRRTVKKGRIVGIDLGTTNSCVAVSLGGKAQVLASREGLRTMPSVVAYDAKGHLLVGQPAKAQMVVNPRNTVYGSKRLLGRPFASPTVQACRDRFHYEIVEGPSGEAAVRFAGRDFSLQQVAAFILTELRDVAIEALGELVDRAVITVPAYYNDHQRNAVREAGQLAGLKVERIVNEPTAAALAFGYGKGLDKRVLVYDLGGGTFDASVLEIQGDVYEVVSTGGDTFLGGMDFDSQIIDHLVYRFAQKHGVIPPEDRIVWQRLRDAAEEVKVLLSARQAARACVPYLFKSESGKDLALEVDLNRSELEELTGRLVDRSIETCREVLFAKGLDSQDIQEVLLVGGQSRMPLVWRRIREEFGREPNKSVHPDEAVALGAALLADSDSRIDSVVLIDVLAMGIGVGLPGGRMAAVLPRNTRLPAEKSYVLATTRDGQSELELHVFQGDAPKVSECEYLGSVKVPGLPARPRGEVRVSIEFSLGGEGILKVSAKELVSGRVTEVRLATVHTPEDLRRELDLPEAQTAPKGARPLEVATRPQGPARSGLFGRIFGPRK